MPYENTPEQPKVPDDLIEQVVASLRERDNQRRKAIDGAWQQLSDAQTEQERDSALANLGRMLEVSEEFHQLFPEVFPPEPENGGQ